MNSVSLTPSQIMAGIGVLLVLLWVWRAGARRAGSATAAARSGARLMSLVGRVASNAAVIVIVQWLVISYGGRWALLVALGLPALFASYAFTKALTVTTYDIPHRRGRGDR
jgi:hypothetical protein